MIWAGHGDTGPRALPLKCAFVPEERDDAVIADGQVSDGDGPTRHPEDGGVQGVFAAGEADAQSAVGTALGAAPWARGVDGFAVDGQPRAQRQQALGLLGRNGAVAAGTHVDEQVAVFADDVHK